MQSQRKTLAKIIKITQKERAEN